MSHNTVIARIAVGKKSYQSEEIQVHALDRVKVRDYARYVPSFCGSPALLQLSQALEIYKRDCQLVDKYGEVNWGAGYPTIELYVNCLHNFRKASAIIPIKGFKGQQYCKHCGLPLVYDSWDKPYCYQCEEVR